MTLDEFRDELVQAVRARAVADANFELSAFLDIAVDTLVDAGEIADFEPCHFRGTGQRKRSLAVDGYAVDGADDSFRLVVADWTGNKELRTLTQSDAKTLLGRVRAFVEEARSGSLTEHVDIATEVYGLGRTIQQARNTVSRYRIYLATDARLSERVKDWPEGAIDGVPVEFHIWDVGRMHRVAESATGRDELEVDFTKHHPGGIPCLAAGVESDDYRAFLCVMPGQVIGDLYNEHGSRLLEGNVRSFLSAKGKVNKGIRKSLQEEPRMFFAYNNGIAATATEAVVRQASGGLRLVSTTDLQIVNGGQTTASLAAAIAESSIDGVFVQMKLAVVPADRSGEVIPRIAKYANSQNKVSEADFFSNHEFHRRMEQLSRGERAPAVGGAQYETRWFYERARGQYVNEQASMSKAEKTRFVTQNPRSQLITKTDFAKVENAWRGLPHIVSLGAQKNFLNFANWITEQWDRSSTGFNNEYFRRAVVKTILFRETERIVSRQDWYEGGYRANIVAYTVARLSTECSKRQRAIDFRGVWTAQSISVPFERQLADVAKSVVSVLTDTPSGIQNVTEWCKKELCWQKVEALPIVLTPEFSRELIDEGDDRSIQAGARAEQGVVDRINAQIEVANLGGGYWAQMLSWGRARNLVSPDQARLLTVASRLPARLPTERESVKLLEIRRELESEGFSSE